MKTILTIILTVTILGNSEHHVQGRPNILFLVSDDMRPEIGAYEGVDYPGPIRPGIVTPNLNALAGSSLLLKRAYVQQPLCSPSRTSLLTGRRPETTHVTDNNNYFREVGGNFTTIPQFFKENGYLTKGIGKIFHPGADASGNDDPLSWSETYYHAPNRNYWNLGSNFSWYAATPEEREVRPLPDEQLTDEAIRSLRQLAPLANSGEQPFFLALGFHKPHLPFVFPEEMLSLYPFEDIELPIDNKSPINMPTLAWNGNNEIRGYADIESLNESGAIDTNLPNKVVRDLRRAYYSSITYVDSLIGRVLNELQDLGLANNTIVSFWGDHGWQIGEVGLWAKMTNFDLATHAPMMVRVPGLTDRGGVATRHLTEYVDLFPTLVEAAGFAPLPLCPADLTFSPLCREGTSLLPLMINGTAAQWKERVFSQVTRNINKNGIELPVMGFSMKTTTHRYTEWVEWNPSPIYRPNWDVVVGVELYDHVNDPKELWNRAADVNMAELTAELSSQLHAGWRAALPSYVLKKKAV